jgi:hypothetical protein
MEAVEDTGLTMPHPGGGTMPDAEPRIGTGHNGGPPLEEPDPDAAWRLWCWRRAHKRAWSAPREIALRRLARAEHLGISYREYTLEILERGRHL